MQLPTTALWEEPDEPLHQLLGLVSSHFDITQKININGETRDAQLDNNSGVAIVIAAQLATALMHLRRDAARSDVGSP